MIGIRKDAVAAAINDARQVHVDTCRVWDLNGTESLGAPFFEALRTVQRACVPDANLSIQVREGEIGPELKDPLHVLVRIAARTVNLTFTSTALSGSPHTRGVTARIIGPILLLTDLCLRPEADGLQFTLGLRDSAEGADVGFCSSGECVLIPDPDFMNSLGYWDFRTSVSQSWQDWPRRKNTVFWRGATTGIQRPPDRWKGVDWFQILARTEMCQRLRSDRWEGKCDVGIYMLVQLHDQDIASRIQQLLGSDRVNRADQIGFRFQMDIDGNTNAWAGLFQALLMGACVIKVESEANFRQWYYKRLQPGRHYVSVASDLSDLEDKIDWALQNQDACCEIASEGYQLSNQMTIDSEIKACSDDIFKAFRKTRCL